MSSWDAKCHTVITVLLPLVMLLRKGQHLLSFESAWGARLYPAEALGKEAVFPPDYGSKLWAAPERDSLTGTPLLSLALRQSAASHQCELKSWWGSCMWPIAPFPYNSGRSIARSVGAAGQWELCRLIIGIHQRRCIDAELIDGN